MSYDIRLNVKVEGWDGYAVVAIPEKDSPTYNVGDIFRKSMDWDFDTSVVEENGEYHKCYYKVSDVLGNIERGVHELQFNPKKYKRYEPSNGWGSVESALEDLESLLDCIKRTARWDEIPLECLYISWV